MKKNGTLLILVFALFSLWATASQQIGTRNYLVDGLKIIQQDRQQGAYEKMVSQLKSLHAQVYELPYDYSYIQNTIIPEINAKRLAVAPHYPTRSTTGEDADEIYKQLRFWFDNYPSECAAYIDFLNAYIAAHAN